MRLTLDVLVEDTDSVLTPAELQQHGERQLSVLVTQALAHGYLPGETAIEVVSHSAEVRQVLLPSQRLAAPPVQPSGDAVVVSASALRQVLGALEGTPKQLQQLLASRSQVDAAGPRDSPIDRLVDQYNAAAAGAIQPLIKHTRLRSFMGEDPDNQGQCPRISFALIPGYGCEIRIARPSSDMETAVTLSGAEMLQMHQGIHKLMAAKHGAPTSLDIGPLHLRRGSLGEPYRSVLDISFPVEGSEWPASVYVAEFESRCMAEFLREAAPGPAPAPAPATVRATSPEPGMSL